MAGESAAPPIRAGRPRLRCRRLDGPPVVALRVCLPGGSRAERLPGTALVTGRGLVEGSRARGWRQVFAQAEDRGVELAGRAGYEAIVLSVDCLASELDRALGWAAELALEPAFEAGRVAWLAEQAAAELAAMADRPAARTSLAFREQIYQPSPRARPLQGSAESLAQLSSEDCRRLHRESLARGPIVAAAGALDEELVARRFDSLFPAGDAAAEQLLPPQPGGEGERRREIGLGRVDQAHLLAGHLTVGLRHPDLPALELLSVVMGAGAGLSGRIPERVRERDGLAYVVGAETAAGAGLDPGRLEIYLSTSPDRLPRAERAVREELARLFEEGPTEEEVASARDYLIASEPFLFESAGQWSNLLVQAELYGLPLADMAWRRARWRGLGRSQVAAAGRRHLSLDDLRLTIGLPGALDDSD